MTDQTPAAALAWAREAQERLAQIDRRALPLTDTVYGPRLLHFQATQNLDNLVGQLSALVGKRRARR